MSTHTRARGFTLIDVLLVLVLVGVLTAMAYPRYRAATARAKRVEARVMLASIWRAQQAEHIRSGTYADSFKKLAVSLDGGQTKDDHTLQGRYYTFTLTQPWGPQSYYVVAEGNIDEDPATDILLLYELPPK